MLFIVKLTTSTESCSSSVTELVGDSEVVGPPELTAGETEVSPMYGIFIQKIMIMIK